MSALAIVTVIAVASQFYVGWRCWAKGRHVGLVRGFHDGWNCGWDRGADSTIEAVERQAREQGIRLNVVRPEPPTPAQVDRRPN